MWRYLSVDVSRNLHDYCMVLWPNCWCWRDPLQHLLLIFCVAWDNTFCGFRAHFFENRISHFTCFFGWNHRFFMFHHVFGYFGFKSQSPFWDVQITIFVYLNPSKSHSIAWFGTFFYMFHHFYSYGPKYQLYVSKSPPCMECIIRSKTIYKWFRAP